MRSQKFKHIQAFTRLSAWFLILGFMQTVAMADALRLTPYSAVVSPGREFLILEDADGSLDFEQARRLLPSQGHYWQGSRSPAFGYSDSVYWARLEISNTLETDSTWVVRFGHPGQNYLDFYFKDAEGNWQISRSGTLRSFNSRDLPYPALNFVFPVFQEQVQFLYFRLSNASLLRLDATLIPIDEFHARSSHSIFFDAMEFGVLTAICILLLLLWVANRNLTFFWLSSFLFIAILFSLTFRGYTSFILQPESTAWVQRFAIVCGYLCAAAGVMFTSYVLRLPSHLEHLGKALKYAAGTVALIAITSPALAVNVATGAVLIGVASCVIAMALIVSLATIRFQRRSTQIVIVAMLVFLVGLSLELLAPVSNRVPDTLLYHNTSALVLLTIVVLLVGLSDAVRRTRKTQQEKLVNLLNAQNLAFDSGYGSKLNDRQFIENITSEVMTPVHGLISLSNIMLQQSPLSINLSLAQIKLHAELVSDSAQKLIDSAALEMPDVSNELVVAPIDLRALCIETASIYKMFFSVDSVHLLEQYPNRALVVCADEVKLQQALLNMLFVVVDHSAQGEKCLKLTCDDSSITVTVSDAGARRPASYFERILRRSTYEPTTETTNDVDLALAVSGEILRRHGSSISLSSSTERGMRASFVLLLQPSVYASGQPISKYQQY